MARFDEIYEKYKKKQKNGIGLTDAETSVSGSYKATGRFAGILANYQKNGASFSGVDDSYVQSFFKDAESFAQKAVEESKNIGWAMATDKAKNEERNRALTDLGNRAKAVKVYLTSNKKSIDPKAYEEYMRFLKNFENDKQSIYDTFLGNTNYYSQWGTQEEYDFHEAHSTPEKRREWYAGLEKRKKELEAQKEREAAAWQETEANANSYDGFEYSEMEEAHWNKLKAIEEEINKIGTEMRQYERGGYNDRGQHYGSKVLDDAAGIMAKKDFAEKFGDPDYRAMSEKELFELQMQEVRNGWEDLTEDETKVYNYLWNTEGKEAALEYRDALQREKNRVAAENRTQTMQKQYQEADIGGKILMNILSVPANVAGGTVAFASDVGKILSGEEIDPNNAAHGLMDYGAAVRQQTAGALDETGLKIPGIDFTLGDAYQAGMSMLDSLTSVGIGGKLGGVLLATGAASREAKRLYDQGATKEQVALGAALAGAAELVFEEISIDKLIKMKDASSVKEFVKNALVQGGVEASEEAVTEIVNTLTNAIVMGNESDWQKLLKDHNGDAVQALLEKAKDVTKAGLGGFLSGAGSGGVAGAVNTVRKNQLTANEKTVVKLEYKNRLAEAEKDGKLTKAQKDKLYKAVVEDLKDGAISTDTIEEALGGDQYRSYREAYDQEESRKKALEDELAKLKDAPNTVGNAKRYDQVAAELEQLKKDSKVQTQKEAVSASVWEMAKNDRLSESYAEKGRRGEAFQADLTKYSGKQRATVQAAISSGILNNTKKTHDFVNMLAKLSADKGVAFDFTSNEKLKSSSFAVEGAVVNGYYNAKANKIGVNVSSAKALNSVVGHEITHVLEGTELYDELQKAVKKYAEAKGDYKGRLDSLKKLYKNVKDADISKELTADLVGDYLFTDSDFVKRLSTENRTLFEKIFDEVKYLYRIATAGSKEARELEKVKKIFEDAFRNSGKAVAKNTQPITNAQNEKGLNRKQEVDFSLSRDTEFSDNAIKKNNQEMTIDPEVLAEAKALRERIAARMNEIKDNGLVGLPEDIEGNTFFSNSSYGGSEENTTICPRSLASEAFVDAVSEYLGRPLTVEEQIYISQDLQGRSLTPECTYCYVATDRKAYRAFLGEYINQRDAVLKDYESGDWDTKTYTNEQIQNMSAEQKARSLYVKFLDGRKPTSNMAKRFSMWIKAAKNGTPLIQASDLANMEKLMGDINSEFGAELKPQIVDAMKYAQSASWAKKRVSYVAYNGHILKWKQSRIDELNSHYGLRMYSFSDFHPAFVLENMQMITDASVRGLKMLGYTKDIDFVDIFAPTGMNINVSTFGFESGGNIYENNIIGAEWEKAKALREKYPNVGITFVATNDAIVEWALNQDWIDVVIPYHLVRTGAEVAKAFNYTNYTSESSDVKDIGWTKGDKKYIAPTDHNNDKATYFDALAKNHLRPRFERFQDHPNYMKLVNECRQSATESKPVQPTFGEEAAMRVLSKLEANGYYQPVGGSVDRMYEIAAEVADDMQKQIAPVMSLSDASDARKQYGDYNVYGEEIGLPGVFEEETAPVKKTKVKAKKPIDSIIAEKKEQLQKAKEELKWIEDHKGSMDLDFEEATTYMQIKKLKEEIESLQSSKSQQKAVGAAESGFNPITHLQYEYGTIPEGEHPVRDDSMPVSTNGKDRVSYTARTVKGAAATPDELVDLLDKETAEGRLSYIPIKNSDTVAKAYDAIVAKGWNEAKGEWSARVRKGETGAEMVATGALLLNNAAKAGDTKAWLDILHDYRMMNTNTAQALQAARILKTLTPDDTLYMMEKSVKQMVEDMKLDKEIVIDEDLAAEYIEAEDENAREAVRKKIVKDVARQIPSKITDWWTALRYLNMLGNFRTQGRNIIGNVGMAVTSEIKNAVAASIEAIASKVSGGNFQRTKSVFVNRDQYNAAKDDFASVEKLTINGGKYNDSLSASTQFAQDVQDEREIFGRLVPLEKYRKLTNRAMEKGDLVFSKRAYARALAGYLKANGITETDFSKVDPQVMDESRAYAVQEAQENTFRDNNWLSSWVSSALRSKKTPKIGKVLGEGLLPFRKTPANVLFRAEEYSPLGIINSTVKSIQLATGKGEVTGADVVNSWAKSLTGTGLFALGFMLNNSGILSGGADEDEEKEWFENLYGLQNYSITIGDYNFTIDFLSPSAMPLLMGAQLNELRQDGGIELKDLEAALLSLADPMIEMSMLQGMNDALDNIRYAESNMGQFLINSALNYLTQGITNSFLGQLERSFEGHRMTTYVDKDSPLPAWLQKAIGSVSAKIPGWDFQQIPYIDAWGETEDVAPMPGFLENALSPTYVDKDVTDELFDELNRLNDAQSDYNVYPSTPEKTLTFDDADGNHHENYNLSAEEYVELAQLQGKTQKALVEQILASEQYAELTDKEKAKAIRSAYTYATEASRIEVLNADGFSAKWMAEAGDDIVNAIIAHTSEERTYAYDYPEKYAVSQAITGDFAKYKEYSKYLNNVEADKDANGKPINGSAKEKKVAYIQSLDLDYGQKIILYKSEYKGDDSYDDDIIEYLRGRSDIPYEEKMTILKTLGIVE